jgi:hypothetical protein
MVRAFKKRHIVFFIVFITVALVLYFVTPDSFPYVFKNVISNNAGVLSSTTSSTTENVFIVKHIETPKQVKAIYMSSCVAGTPSFREKLVDIAKTTEINSLIIDIKDYSGLVSIKTGNDVFDKSYQLSDCRVRDMKEFIEHLHDLDIYVIGRITAFQDSYITKIHPEWAVKKNSDKNVVWKDRKGISFVDAGNKEMWKYLVDLAKASYAIGFDEINFDYIRFPSDGNMNDIYYPWSNDTIINNIASNAIGTSTPAVKGGKSIIMRNFFEYLHNNLKDTGIVTSADLFGMTTTNYDDLNIGQILEDAAPYFDYIAPMVYPSHYPVGFLNYKSVAEVNANGYNIVNYSMKIAVERLKAIGENPLKLRPWLQDNDYPVRYTSAMVREQIQATYDSGLDSWMLWDAGNTYTIEALLPKATSTVLNN